jgi:serine protease AprX
MMKTGKLARLLLTCCIAFTGASAQQQYAFRIAFTDKKGTPANIHAPSAFLSLRAQERRNRQFLTVDSSDLPLSAHYTDSVLLVTNGIMHLKSRWLNQCVVLMSDTTAVASVRSKPFVRSADFIAYYPAPLHLLRKERLAGSREKEALRDKGGLFRTTSSAGYYGDAYDQIYLAHGDYLHSKGYRGRGKMIAVIDAGFQGTDALPGYDSLRIEGRIADTYNFTLDTNDVYGYSAHGTQVLSTMAGILNGSYVGTAPDADYALYISEDNFSEQPIEMDNLLSAMERADSLGADIINVSLGYNTFLVGTWNASLSLSDIDGKSTVAAKAANKATQKGMLVIASAGNEGGGSWRKVLTPGDADSALTIGSVDINKVHSTSSGNGPNAAGVLKPDVCMLGAPSMVLNLSGTTAASNGTSLATPELAGLAACLWGAVPGATPFRLRDLIRKSAHVASMPDSLLGYGVPDFEQIARLLDIQKPGHNITLNFYPNPFTDDLKARVPSGFAAPFSWLLTDLQGKTIVNGTGQTPSGSGELHFPLPGNLPAGMYFMKLTFGGDVQVFKLVHR